MSPSLFRRATLVGALAVLLAPALAHAAEWYVSPTGSDSAAGSSGAPFATLSKANSAAGAGDTIWVHGGTYYITSQLTLSKSGTSDSNRTKIWAVAGETPVLDISRYNTTNSAADVPAVLVTGSWMHLRGLEIANAKVGASGDHSYSLLRTKNASNNTFELLNLHHGFGPGLFIDTGNGGNLILNCDSHDNYDVNGSQGDGQNGDGFGIHYQMSGPSSVIRGCRAWNDSDDGYDFISQEVPVTIEDSFAMSNGRGADGNGNGFKIGSSQTGVRHIVRNNVAWKNKAAGFYANHSTGGNTWYNNTSYMNSSAQYNMLASSFDSSGNVTGTIILTGSKAHIMRNNIGFPNRNSNMDGVDTMFNTWDLGISEASTEADGSMPAACTFMHLKAGSPLIDKGTNVQLPYVGSAPDLGAYEYGATSTGTGGAGGSTGAGGAAGTTGSAGRGGTTGSAGAGGTTGAAGRGGTTGSAGATGAAGRGGTTGAGGTIGAAGSVGTTGTAGTGVSTGTAGTGVSTGTAGTGVSTGTAGSIGTTGTAGSGVSTGSAGTGVSSGSAGTSGGGGTNVTTGSGGNGSTGAAGNGTGETGDSGCSCNAGGTNVTSLFGIALMAMFLRGRSRSVRRRQR
jgi:hypothetical protein